MILSTILGKSKAEIEKYESKYFDEKDELKRSSLNRWHWVWFSLDTMPDDRGPIQQRRESIPLRLDDSMLTVIFLFESIVWAVGVEKLFRPMISILTVRSQCLDGFYEKIR